MDQESLTNPSRGVRWLVLCGTQWQLIRFLFKTRFCRLHKHSYVERKALRIIGENGKKGKQEKWTIKRKEKKEIKIQGKPMSGNDSRMNLQCKRGLCVQGNKNRARLRGDGEGDEWRGWPAGRGRRRSNDSKGVQRHEGVHGILKSAVRSKYNPQDTAGCNIFWLPYNTSSLALAL